MMFTGTFNMLFASILHQSTNEIVEEIMSNFRRFRLNVFLAVVSIGVFSAVSAAADRNPDSAAGNCGSINTENKGIGDSLGGVFIPNLKAGAEAAEMSLGQYKKIINHPAGYAVPTDCAPGQPSLFLNQHRN